ncbi:SURF1 family protein [uncultured Sphingomonas sp.]|uniref:SURF1 family protein n=1 Tax=uncultured Sphingomonas sp. TaxID=158754 RepID=UPI0025E518BF|nr:SURF1 family protein [uncultured Sphingomonas sp.]
MTTRRRPFLALLAALVTAALVGLGVWQLERRAWKLDLIARVEARIHAAPIAFPWRGGDPKDLEYTRVRVTGTFDHDRETLVQALTARGAGFWVLTPLRTADGTMLVNRGFVPEDRRDPKSRAAGQVAGPIPVTGLVRLSEPGGGFLRSNDPAADRWYSRDVAAIAAAKGLGRVAAQFVDADATPNPGGYPIGGLTVVAFRNTHLVYALTWFALAGLAAFGTWLFWRGERRA